MILRNLLRRKTRTFLTLVGIAMGVAAIVALVAIADGFASGYYGLLSGSEADLVITQAESFDMSISVIDEAVGPQLAAISGVEEVEGPAEVGVILDEARPGARVIPIPLRQRVQGQDLRRGRFHA